MIGEILTLFMNMLVITTISENIEQWMVLIHVEMY